ncbi:MAG: RNA-binding protein [Actinobacteria bacterium]|nr:RNA-binding protein [Actinomycetota bacterium]
MNIYVGNLDYATSSEDIQAAFEEFGTVDSANVITDRQTGRSKGFGFIEMDDKDKAKGAIEALDGKDLEGRAINVNKAKPKREESRGSYRF